VSDEKRVCGIRRSGCRIAITFGITLCDATAPCMLQRHPATFPRADCEATLCAGGAAASVVRSSGHAISTTGAGSMRIPSIRRASSGNERARRVGAHASKPCLEPVRCVTVRSSSEQIRKEETTRRERALRARERAPTALNIPAGTLPSLAVHSSSLPIARERPMFYQACLHASRGGRIAQKAIH
jgi:hypothetical protein